MNSRDGSSPDMNESLPTPSDLDADTAERLLSGQIDAADAPPGYAGVARVLAAASANATAMEAAGEAEALAMFRSEIDEQRRVPTAAAPVVSLDEHRSRRVSRKAVLVGVVAGVILASTGVAAATGDLPEPVQRVAHETLSHIGVSVPSPPPKQAPEPRPAKERPTPETKPAPSSTAPAARSNQPGTPPTSAPRSSTPPSTAPAAPTTQPSTPPSSPSTTVPNSPTPPPSTVNRPVNPNTAAPITAVPPTPPTTRGSNPAPTGP